MPYARRIKTLRPVWRVMLTLQMGTISVEKVYL